MNEVGYYTSCNMFCFNDHYLLYKYRSSDFQKFVRKGICVSWPLPLTLAPGLQFEFTGLGPHFVFSRPSDQFVFTGSGP